MYFYGRSGRHVALKSSKLHASMSDGRLTITEQASNIVYINKALKYAARNDDCISAVCFRISVQTDLKLLIKDKHHFK